MKALIINGSPKSDGAVAKILKEISIDLKNRFEVNWVDIYKSDIKPCVGCRDCRKNDTECIQREDDAHIIGRKIKEANALIIGTPTYFSNMSAPLKSLIDRNGTTLFTETSGMPIPKHKGKPAIIVTACMSPSFLSFVLGMARGAIKCVKVPLKVGGFNIIGTIIRSGTAKNEDMQSSLVKKVKRLSKKLAKSVSIN